MTSLDDVTRDESMSVEEFRRRWPLQTRAGAIDLDLLPPETELLVSVATTTFGTYALSVRLPSEGGS